MFDRLRYPGILFLLLVLTFTACQKKKGVTGDEFIEREVLVDVLDVLRVKLQPQDGVTRKLELFPLIALGAVPATGQPGRALQ